VDAPVRSQKSKFSLETKKLRSPRISINYFITNNVLPLSTLQGLTDYTQLSGSSYLLQICGQILYICVPIYLLFASGAEKVVA